MAKKLSIAVVVFGSLLLSACTLPISRSGKEAPYTGPVAKPQVVYRINEQRFFEIVPLREEACSTAGLYFIDTVKNIRSRVSIFMAGYNLRTDFVIDAANDQFLVAPIVRGNPDCQSGGGGCGGSRLPYSTDGGRTWKRLETLTSGPIDLIDSQVYLSTNVEIIQRRETEFLDLAKGKFSLFDWTRKMTTAMNIPKPRKAPIDTKFHCNPNGKE